VEGSILPQIQFIMNRSKNFVAINAQLIMCLKNYKIEDLETLKKWTTELLGDETLMSLEKKDEVTMYMVGVNGLCSETHGMKAALVMDILVDQFKQSKRGQAMCTTEQR